MPDESGLSRVHICTIIARNYVAHARVLAKSFKQVHPEGTCSVLVIDDPSGFIDAQSEPFELVSVEKIGLPDTEQMAASYDVMEFSTAVKPWLLRHLLERPGVDSVAYLDPDIRIFSSIEEIAERAQRHSVVLTPHFTAPLPRDSRKPSEEDILIAGTYNLGFIGLGAGKTADALLDWWSERLERHCLNNPAQGHFVDQRWIDLAPGLWPGIDILRDPNFNIAYWNLPTRKLEDDGEDFRVDGLPLRFFHFSGFDPRRPRELSKHQNRIDVAGDPALTRICRLYADELLANGFQEAIGWPYGWDEMGNGVKLDPAARRVHREAAEAGELEGSIFTEEGADRFVSYLGEPEHIAGANGSINRYATALWESREDFRRHFPSIAGERGPAFVEWLHHTAPDTGVATGLLPPPPATSNGAAAAPPPDPVHTVPGVNLVGYLSAARGVGEAARKVLAALEAGDDTDLATIDCPPDPKRIANELGGLGTADYPYDFNLLCINADMLSLVAAGLGPKFFAGRRSAGLWFWEVTRFPDEWQGAFEHLDEVWVASEYIAGALEPLSPVPVRTIRLPLTPAAPPQRSRAELGLPEGFCFLFVFDFRSVFKRKNPLGAIEAFCNAFEPGEGPSLVIKSICADEFPEQREALAVAAAARPEIHLIEDKVPVEVKDAMIASCDCYVSLHRSEGLGLTMAEAMYFGRPVIATAYSGNLDFMTPDNSYLVPHTMVEIGSDAPPYPADGVWAEPDLAYASRVMRDVFHDPEAAAERGQRAAADIRRTHSLAAAGDVISAAVAAGRRQRLLARLKHPAFQEEDRRAPISGREQLEHLLVGGVAPVRPGAGRFRRTAKRLYRSLLRPYAQYQQAVNGSLTQSLDELRDMLGETLKMDGAVDTKATHTSQGLRLLSYEVERDRERGAKAEDLVEEVAAEPFMADERLAAHEHPLLGETVGFRAGAEEAASDGYRGFEDLFRGSEEMIRDRQRVYLKLLAGHAPVLDAGCGRGEFLDLLQEEGIEYRGVDLDPGMVERCRQKGHSSVEQGDMLAALEAAEPGSLGAIFTAQVIEHIEFEQLKRFLEVGVSRLKPGGLLIAETVNPHSVAALKTFWVDPTHKHPLFPETVLELCQLAGYASGDVFAPVGTGDWGRDRTRVGEYAVVASAPGGDA